VTAKRMVVQRSDLPRGFVLRASESGPRPNARVVREHGPSTRAKLRRWGRITGYVAVYGARDASKGELPGVFSILGNVSLYRTPAGARSSLGDRDAGCGRADATPIPLAGQAPIGPQTRLCSLIRRINGVDTRLFLAQWRNGRATGGVAVHAVEGAVTPLTALIVGRKENRRMTAELARG
jgi:hypothetical protein